jgi:hypothetical protein
MDSMSEMASDRDEFHNKETNEKQLERLESNIEILKRENEELQKKIAIIYEFKKTENRDDRNYYKVKLLILNFRSQILMNQLTQIL